MRNYLVKCSSLSEGKDIRFYFESIGVNMAGYSMKTINQYYGFKDSIFGCYENTRGCEVVTLEYLINVKR